mgnify:CR=1 FL=1
MNGKCILCGENLYEESLYILKNMPQVSQNLPTIDNLKDDKKIDLKLSQCRKCGLVQLDCEPVYYYKDSTRAAERSEGLINLREEEYRYLIEKYNLKGKKIIEIGAGKGGYLRTLKDMTEYNISEYGIENNIEFVKEAQGLGVNVFQGDVENKEVDLPGAPYDAFVSFSYLARLINPNNMVSLIEKNLTENGIGYILVPSLEHLMNGTGYFDIVRDHIAYYDIETLRFLFTKNNFEILEYGNKLNLYTYVVVRKRKRLNIKKHWDYVENLIKKVQQYVSEKKNENKKIAVWCAGHYAFTVLSTTEIEENIDYIIDNAKIKQGHFAPGSKLPIVGPEHFNEAPVDVIMILGPIYIDEIVKEIRGKYSKKIEIVTLDKDGIKECG